MAVTALVTSPPTVPNIPILPSFNHFLNYPSPGDFYPMIPFMMPNQFQNICAPDYQYHTTSSTSVNIERPSNEIFEASEPGHFQQP